MATLTLPIPTESTEVFATLKKFVVAYDFSPSAETTLEYALDLAARQDAELILVHAQGCQAAAVGGDRQATAHGAANTQFEFDLLVDRLLREGVAAQSTLLYGAPKRVISERA